MDIQNLFVINNLEVAEDLPITDMDILYDLDIKIAKGTIIGNNVAIYEGTHIGRNCQICDNAVLGRQPISGPTSIRPAEKQPGLIIEDNVVIGTGAVIYAGCTIKEGAMVADLVAMRENCIIGKGSRVGRSTTMECNVEVGKNTVIQTACHITGDCWIKDNVFLGPEVCTMNDKYMSRQDWKLLGPVICNGASVGANATLMAGILIQERATIGAGAVVTKDVPSGETWVGNPARRIK